MRLAAALILTLAAVAPGCGSHGGGGSPVLPPVFFDSFYVDGGTLKGVNASGVTDIDTGIAAWRSIHHKSISGTNATMVSPTRFIAYIKGGEIFSFDTAEGFVAGDNPHKAGSETAANAIVALVDCQQVETYDTTTFLFYTTTPVGGLVDFKAAGLFQHLHPVPDEHADPALLEAGISATSTFDVRPPGNASNFVYWLRSSGTGVVKRAELVRFPVTQINTMSSADDVLEYLPQDYDTIVYRRADGDIMESTIPGLPDPVPNQRYDAPATETTRLLGIVATATLDGEVFFSSLAAAGLTLRRVMSSGAGLTTFDGPLAATVVPFNEVAFTGARVVWAHVRDMTSHVRSYDRTAPATSSDLLTGGRALVPGPTVVAWDGASYVVAFRETGFLVAKSEMGALINERALMGPTAALHVPSGRYDITLNRFFPSATASRVVFAEATFLRSRTLDLAAASELTVGALPGDITAFLPDGAFGLRDVIAGTDGAQTDMFRFDASAAFSTTRLTSTPASSEVPVGAP